MILFLVGLILFAIAGGIIFDRHQLVEAAVANAAALEPKNLANTAPIKEIPPQRLTEISSNNSFADVKLKASPQARSPEAAHSALELPPLSSEKYLPAAFEGYVWPAQGTFTSGYGWRWGRFHRGIDIAAPIGTPVKAAAAGTVIAADWNSGGYGNLVELQHADGSVTMYAHNNKILVSLGEKVAQNQQIAEMGNTGYSTGSHLHFEIHLSGDSAVDPMTFLSSK